MKRSERKRTTKCITMRYKMLQTKLLLHARSWHNVAAAVAANVVSTLSLALQWQLDFFFFSFIPSSLVLLLLLYALYCRIALNNTSAPFANMAYLLSHCCVVAIFVVATTFYSRVFRFTFGSYYLCALYVVYAQKSQPSFAC